MQNGEGKSTSVQYVLLDLCIDLFIHNIKSCICVASGKPSSLRGCG